MYIDHQVPTKATPKDYHMFQLSVTEMAQRGEHSPLTNLKPVPGVEMRVNNKREEKYRKWKKKTRIVCAALSFYSHRNFLHSPNLRLDVFVFRVMR